MSQKMDTDSGPILEILALQGPDRGKRFALETGREYLMGRSEECDIKIDQFDKTVSRKHARLRAGSSSISLESLNPANPVQIKGKAVSMATIKPGTRFQIGTNLFTLESAGKAASFPTPSMNLRNILLITLAAVILGFTAVLFTGGDKQKQEPRLITQSPGSGSSENFAPTDTIAALPGIGEVSVSDENQEISEQHFRQGMFFYDTGNTLRAVTEWEKALGLNPNHSDARIWFLKAEKELEDKIREHYQNALLHYKYMRYNQAVYEFRMVVELSRDKNNDQYINALRYINELKGR